MAERDELDRLRAERVRAEMAIRRRERFMAEEEREMEAAMRRFEEDEDGAERAIEAEWRRERWGREPERPVAWRSDQRRRDRAGR